MYKVPKVTCIITTFNRANYLKQAIDSVLAQDYGMFELIVVDDGSTDDTASIVKGYGTQLKYIFQHNKGASAARNLGLEMAEGEYIAYLDSDDLWEPRKLSIQTRFLDQNTDFPLCYTQEIWYRKGVRVNPGYKHRKYSGHIFTKCLPLCIISPSSAMIRRKALEDLGGFDEVLPAAEDYDLWLRITAAQPVYFIPIPLIIKRGGHQDQLSRKVINLDKYRIHALVKILSRRTLSSENQWAAWQELSGKCRIYGNGCNKHGRSEEADFYINLPQKILSGLKEGNEIRINFNKLLDLSHSAAYFEMANYT
ncbi:MAG: glycosyltransferase family 2 protein [bacterium]